MVRHVNPQLAIAAVPRIGRDKSDGVLLPELTADGCTVVPYRGGETVAWRLEAAARP